MHEGILDIYFGNEPNRLGKEQNSNFNTNNFSKLKMN